MKIIFILLFNFALFSIAPFTTLAQEIATHSLLSKEFAPWKERDRKQYNGTYYGKIDRDSDASLTVNYELKVTDSLNQTPEFFASGIYKLQTINSPEKIIFFKSAFSLKEGVAETGLFSLFFVTHKNKKGVIVGSHFLAKVK